MRSSDVDNAARELVSVKDKSKRFGLSDQIGGVYFFATIGAAVDAFLIKG